MFQDADDRANTLRREAADRRRPFQTGESDSNAVKEVKAMLRGMKAIIYFLGSSQPVQYERTLPRYVSNYSALRILCLSPTMRLW